MRRGVNFDCCRLLADPQRVSAASAGVVPHGEGTPWRCREPRGPVASSFETRRRRLRMRFGGLRPEPFFAPNPCSRRKLPHESHLPVFIQRVNFSPEKHQGAGRGRGEGAQRCIQSAERRVVAAVSVPDLHRGGLGSRDPTVPHSGLSDPVAR